MLGLGNYLRRRAAGISVFEFADALYGISDRQYGPGHDLYRSKLGIDSCACWGNP